MLMRYVYSSDNYSTRIFYNPKPLCNLILLWFFHRKFSWLMAHDHIFSEISSPFRSHHISITLGSALPPPYVSLSVPPQASYLDLDFHCQTKSAAPHSVK